MDLEMKSLLYFILIIFTALFGLAVCAKGAFQYYQAQQLSTLGLNTKFAALNCYAKIDEKWLLCDIVTSNIQNINIKHVSQ